MNLSAQTWREHEGLEDGVLGVLVHDHDEKPLPICRDLFPKCEHDAGEAGVACNLGNSMLQTDPVAIYNRQGDGCAGCLICSSLIDMPDMASGAYCPTYILPQVGNLQDHTP